MSIKNNKNATELLSLILSLMDDDDRAVETAEGSAAWLDKYHY